MIMMMSHRDHDHDYNRHRHDHDHHNQHHDDGNQGPARSMDGPSLATLPHPPPLVKTMITDYFNGKKYEDEDEDEDDDEER
jgi:hypothetical protein